MDEIVNTEVPKDLVEIAKVMTGLNQMADLDDDALAVMPPVSVAALILKERTAEEDESLWAWIHEQTGLAGRAEAILEQLPDADPDNLPAWMGQPWAFPLQSRWGANLGAAVEEAQEWLTST